MGELLNLAAVEVCQFLDKNLPMLGDADWWNLRVVNKLSFQQQRYAEQHDITGVTGLDLAALLRILDQNWYDLNWKSRNSSSGTTHSAINCEIKFPT